MRTRIPLTTLAALGLLALSTPAAHAAPASIGKVTQSGNAVSVKVTNPNRYKLRGSLSLVSGQQLVARERTTVRGHGSALVRLAVPSGAPRRVTLVTRLARKGHKAATTRRSVQLAKPGKGTKAPGTVKAPTAPSAASNLWTASFAGGGEISLRVENGTISLAKPTDMGVICNSSGLYTGTAQSMEHFNADQNWPIGNQDEIRQVDTTRLNVLMDTEIHRVSFKLSSSRSGDTITGALAQSFFGSKYDVWTGGMSYVNCSGTAEFTAHPTA